MIFVLYQELLFLVLKGACFTNQFSNPKENIQTRNRSCVLIEIAIKSYNPMCELCNLFKKFCKMIPIKQTQLCIKNERG
jgi:hypothetical protein